MKTAIFHVKKSGLLTTIQDVGRVGYQQYGIVVSGAMDNFAHRIGNLLVGNDPTAATLEVTMMGPEIRVLDDTVIAITGADLSATIDGRAVRPWRSIYAKKGQTLAFGQPKHGVRAYIAVAGGINCNEVLGSKATYLKANMGGIDGREIRKGDILSCGEMNASHKKLSGRVLSPEIIPNYTSGKPFRVIVGPDHHAFTEKGLTTFFNEWYAITREVDRMGCRLSGTVIEHREEADILSDAITVGTIQVPASGQPIVLLADRQTSGGYTRIGTVITTDIPRLVQQMPGTKISFEKISVEKAQQLYRRQEKNMKLLKIATNTKLSKSLL